MGMRPDRHASSHHFPCFIPTEETPKCLGNLFSLRRLRQLTDKSRWVGILRPLVFRQYDAQTLAHAVPINVHCQIARIAKREPSLPGQSSQR